MENQAIGFREGFSEIANMIKVLFFAKIREDLGVSSLEISFTHELKSINDLIELLSLSQKPYGRQIKEILTAQNTVIAQNYKVVNAQSAIKDGDEIAFYPPVTGG